MNGGSDGNSGTWVTAGSGNTSVTFVTGYVWVRQKNLPANMRQVANIASPESAPYVTVSDKNSWNAIFRKSGGVQVTTADGYEYNRNSAGWLNITDTTSISTQGSNTIYVRKKATATKLPSEQTTNLD